MTLLADAITWRKHGYMPLPVATDGSKRPAVQTWTAHQKQLAELPEIIDLFTVDHDGIGLICGAVSGGLEMLELEGRAVTEGLTDQLAQAFTDHDQANLWETVNSGYVERTPSGGIHWYYRIEGSHVGRSTKLARRPATDAELAQDPKNKIQVLAETRGEGGFTVIAPSAGRTHPTGQPWTVLTGSPDTIPTITVEDVDAIHAITSTLDQMPDQAYDTGPAQAPRLPGDDQQLRPGDDFNQHATWTEILEPHGWKIIRRFGGNLYGWQRPGKTHPGLSATTGRNVEDRLYVFSTSTEFEPEKPYSKFSAYTLLEHAGNHSAAARALRERGYGHTEPIAPNPSPPTAPARQDPTPTSGANALQPDVNTTPRLVDADQVGKAYGPTEDGTARALAHLYARQLRYCPQRGSWLTWNGARWQWDQNEQHRELIRSIARNLPDDDGWKAYKKRALSAAGVTGIARLAQSDTQLTVHIDDLDARPYELNTPAGIINLTTGQLRPPEPDALHTRSTAVAPDFDRIGERFQRFLATTFGGDQALIAYVQRLIGVSAIGTVLEQILPFAHGPGANGKSTLIEATMSGLGRNETGYAIAAPSEMLMVRKHTEHPAEIAQLTGARLVVCSELDDGQRFAEARIKQLTGRDSINARFMRRDPFTFTPTHTIWLIGNHKPDATTGGPAFWRRIKLVPFDHVVDEKDRDPKLPEKLQEESAAILAWIARGAASYMEAGQLNTPDAVAEATREYASDQDTIGRFVTEQCHVAPGSGTYVAVQVGRLRDAYEHWCREAGDTPMMPRRFTQELRDRFSVTSDKGAKGRRFYHGISLLDSDDEEGE